MVEIFKQTKNRNIQVREPERPPLSRAFTFKADAINGVNEIKDLMHWGAPVFPAMEEKLLGSRLVVVICLHPKRF